MEDEGLIDENCPECGYFWLDCQCDDLTMYDTYDDEDE